MATTTHDWKLVAPWYRWDLRDDPDEERADEAGRPTIQKYVSTDFVEDFLADPQRSVVFDARDVRQVAVPAPTIGGKWTTLSGTTLVPDEHATRKLFLPSHQRFYVVTVGLHCDRPGFPRVDPAAVAEIGFVIRRHRVTIPEGAEKEAAKLLHELATARACARFKQQYDVARERARRLRPFSSRARARVPSPSDATVAALRDVELARRRLNTWAAEVGVETRTEGWLTSDEGQFGSWVPIDDAPIDLVERSYPLRPVRPRPDDPDHAAHDGPIHFAHLPTGSDEVDASGSGRFNERDTYEIVAFARRDEGACPGELVWSAPSRPFALASFYDPAGCAQRPTEVRLPDFTTLAASTDLPSVKMTAPPESSLPTQFDGDVESPDSLEPRPGEEICFFSIPLITIVALFLLNIVLPIVVMIFSLYWMLALKFCIPPSIDLEIDLAADLSIQPGEFTLEAALEFGDDNPAQMPGLTRHYNRMSTGDPSSTSDWALGGGMEGSPDPISNRALLENLGRQGLGQPSTWTPDFTSAVTYVERVEFDQVVHP